MRGAQVPKTKQFGTFMTNCHPIVEELAASVKNHEVSSSASATSVLRGLRRTLEEITVAVDDVEAGLSVEEECPAQRNAWESGQMTNELDCSRTRKWWLLLSRKS